MISADEQALICDLAETYHIFDYRSLPVDLVATLSTGLRDNSRIRMILNKEKHSRELILSALVVDKLTLLQCGLAGQKERPKLITDILFDYEYDNQNKIQADVFDTPEAFREAYDRAVKGDI